MPLIIEIFRKNPEQPKKPGKNEIRHQHGKRKDQRGGGKGKKTKP